MMESKEMRAAAWTDGYAARGKALCAICRYAIEGKKKMNKAMFALRWLRRLVRNYPVSCFYILVIWILCFMDVPDTPLKNVTLADKWAHILMYAGTCGTMWFEYLHRHKKVDWLRVFVFAWLAPLLMSGLIELLQAYCTGGRRSGDWLDFVANGIGVTVGSVIGILLVCYRAIRKKGC